METEIPKMQINKNIQLPTLDVTQYVGRRAKINDVKYLSGEIKGKETRYIRYTTEIIDTVGTKDKKIELKATRQFSLYQGEDGTWGYNDTTALGKWLNEKHCNEIENAIGKTVVIQTRTADDGKKYLTFD